MKLYWDRTDQRDDGDGLCQACTAKQRCIPLRVPADLGDLVRPHPQLSVFGQGRVLGSEVPNRVAPIGLALAPDRDR